MILRSCWDLVVKQVLLPRPLSVVGCQTVPWYSSKASKASKALKLEAIPTCPKRSKSAWVFFFSERFPRIRKEFEALSLSRAELFSKIAEEWKSIDEDSRKKYNELAADAKKKYTKEIQEFRSKLSEEDKLAIAQLKANKKVASHKKQLKALGMPKKPPNAYILFSMDYIKENFENRQDVFKRAAVVGAAWSKLSASERAKYVDAAAVLDKEYRQTLDKWEAEMTAKGHIEVFDTKPKSKS